MAVLPALAQNKQAVPRINGGVGPVVAASTDFRSLPENAQTFINTLFPSTTVTSVKNDFKDQEYDVKMSDGYEITFDYNGNWTQVEAPDGVTLPSSTLVAMVPEETVIATFSGNDLLTGGVINAVEEIEAYPNGYVVEYVTGTYGTGKAAVSKTDGSVVSGRNKSAIKGKMAKNDRQNKSRKGDARAARMAKQKNNANPNSNSNAARTQRVNYIPQK